MGGNRADAGHQGGGPNNTSSQPQCDDGGDPPKDNGGASTPQWLFDRCSQLAVEACGKLITLDVAAAPWNAKCKRYFTEADDGLKQDWDAKAVFCNPPYSAMIIESFVCKAIDEVQHGITSVLLVPWWNYPYLDLCERHGRIHRICSPVTFQRQDGSTLTMNNQYRTTPLVVVVFGPTIQPGFGAPIRKGDIATHDLDAEDEGIGDVLPSANGGITARAIAGDRDRHRTCKEADWEQLPITKWLNTVHQGDCLEVMARMPKNSIDLIVTSPPYNLRNSTGGGLTNGSGSLWDNAPLSHGYADGNTDDMPYDDYVAWQRKCLTAMMRLLKDDGALFYNHKWRVQDGLLQDRHDIVSGFPVRQIIIWQRSGGINFNLQYFLPTYEVIYLICNKDFRLTSKDPEHPKAACGVGDVWKINQDIGNDHPALFPVELPKRCIESTDATIVLDPFIGSGTTAIAAKMLGVNWIGIEISKQYCKLANARISSWDEGPPKNG